MRKVVLIGGAPAVGKSSLARLMSEQLKLPWISTDGIRDVMRKIVRKEDYPELFDLDEENLTAEEYLSTHTPQQIVDDQNRESRDVWKGVQAFLETDCVWESFIVEGIAVIPELVSKLDIKDVEVYPIFLAEGNEERIKQTVYSRGVWDDAHTYSDDVKPVEVEWVKLFNEWLLEEAGKYNFASTILSDVDRTFIETIRRVEDWLR